MSNKPKPMSDKDVRNVVKTAIEEAVDYVESNITPNRERAMRYFEGKCDVGHERDALRSYRLRSATPSARSSRA